LGFRTIFFVVFSIFFGIVKIPSHTFYPGVPHG
jgi:hypothetical protein